MPHRWRTTILVDETEALRVLSDLADRCWLFRGQPKRYGSLVPSIDREGRAGLSRAEKLTLERNSIERFRTTAKYFADGGERGAQTDDVVALIVLRHYGVPTRLLDWSRSPWVAAYFATEGHDPGGGEIWAFDGPLYEQEGAKQWKRWPETTTDGSGDRLKFDAKLTAFAGNEPPDWFICVSYEPGFHRQNAQKSAYTMTARFGRDHAAAIAELLAQSDRYHLYVIAPGLMPKLHRVLRQRHGVWRGTLFPDSAGAAATAGAVFSNDGA